MKRVLLLSLAVLFVGACEDEAPLIGPAVDGPAATLTTTACGGLVGGQLTDCLALVALYNATNGDAWTNSDNWGTAFHCDWYAIRCSDDGTDRVTEIRLGFNNLVGTIPAEIAHLSALEHLNLAQNHLSGSIPDLSGLINLKAIYVGGNDLTGDVPAWLGRLSNLTHINLSNNELSGTIPVQLGTLSNLSELDLRINDISGPVPGELNTLSRLKYLYLDNNKLTGPLPELTGLTRLEFLSLGGNPVGGQIPTWPVALEHLRAIVLRGANLSGPIPDELGSMAALELLDLSDNALNSEIPAALGSLPRIYNLVLRNSGLTGPIPPELGNLTTLSGLLIDYNDLSGPIPAEIGNMSGLTMFTAQYSNLSGEIPPSLGNLSQLTGLFLEGNRLEGSIPGSLGNLAALEYLDLSHNNLSGSVPIELANLHSSPLTLQMLDLQLNQLSGALPFEVARLGAALQEAQPNYGCKMAGNVELYVPGTPEYRALVPGDHLCQLAFQNSAPVADAGANQSVMEGDVVTLDASGSADPEGDPLTFDWDPGDGSGVISGAGPVVTHQYRDNGQYTATVTVSDGELQDTDAATIFVDNVAPLLLIPTAGLTPDPIQVGTSYDLALTFTDPGLDDTHTAAINWGGEKTTPSVSFSPVTGQGSIEESHTWTEPGIYTVVVEVQDDDGGRDQAIAAEIVVYDADGGFVTGAGRFESPPGAFLWDPGASGPATFGFQSKYTAGTQTPTGNAGFRFKAGNLDFRSVSYDWLVVNQGGTNAQFKGEGTINGKQPAIGGYYKFMIWATDGDPDEFAIRIWYEGGSGEVLVYYGGSSIGPQGSGTGQIRVQKN